MAGIGKSARKPSHGRYVSENRRLANKQRRVLKATQGKWTYEALVAHGKKKEPEALKRKLVELTRELQKLKELKQERFERKRGWLEEKEQERKALLGRLKRIASAA